MSDTLQTVDNASVDWLLKELNSYERLPTTAVANAWHSLEPEGSTEKVFRDAGGFAAWMAYFLTKRATNKATNFAGKASATRQIEGFDAQTEEARKSLAISVVSKITGDTRDKVNKFYEKIINASQQPNKRRRE